VGIGSEVQGRTLRKPTPFKEERASVATSVAMMVRQAKKLILGNSDNQTTGERRLSDGTNVMIWGATPKQGSVSGDWNNGGHTAEDVVLQ
jgi:hypothetical protein